MQLRFLKLEYIFDWQQHFNNAGGNYDTGSDCLKDCCSIRHVLQKASGYGREILNDTQTYSSFKHSSFRYKKNGGEDCGN